MINRLSLCIGESRSSIWHHSLTLSIPDLGTEVRLWGHAKDAAGLKKRRNERRLVCWRIRIDEGEKLKHNIRVIGVSVNSLWHTEEYSKESHDLQPLHS
jgi:hypothetical protein